MFTKKKKKKTVADLVFVTIIADIALQYCHHTCHHYGHQKYV